MYQGGFAIRPANVIAVLCAITACASAGETTANFLPAAATHTVDFRREVLPVLSQHCFKCHASGRKRGGLGMTGREDLLKGGDSGAAAIEPGNGAKSLLIQLVAGHDPERIMPAEGKRLSPQQIGVLRAWIDQGAKWDEDRPYRLALTDVKVPEGNGHPIDQLLAPYFKAHGIAPSAEPVGDARFARRVALDLIGVAPSPEQLDEFLKDPRLGRRERYIGRLLSDRENYAGHWMTFWSDHLRIGSAVDAGIFDNDETKKPQQWLKAQLDRGVPYDRFVRELIAGEFYEQYAHSIAPSGEIASPVDRPEMQVATTLSQVFLGVQLKCASCHDSFVDRWTLRDAWGLAGALGDPGIEIQRCQMPTGERAKPSFPLKGLGEIDPAASAPQRRGRVAEMMTSTANGLFARTIVNRLWARLMGSGLIEPLDEMMDHEPWSPELLDWLAGELIRGNYDLRHVLTLITTSKVYQLPPAVAAAAKAQADGYVFRGPQLRRLTAEQFVDALASLQNPSGMTESTPARAWQRENNRLMTVLGRPERAVVVTSRELDVTPLVALELINGGQLEQLVERGAEAQLKQTADPTQLLSRIYRTLLSRGPTSQEQRVVGAILGERPTRETLADAIWTVVMLPEFQLAP